MRELGAARDDNPLVVLVAGLGNQLSEAGVFVVSAPEFGSGAAMKSHLI
ncbi:hypothetical protein QCM80_45070 [Bradyrhizobium sp. SSUT112]|nr:hypothetical protein [Bradyrhizobium sp. SSUT112]MDH2357644.1 hypothetical protein [Bradyrhizobium sp. SSUT112]